MVMVRSRVERFRIGPRGRRFAHLRRLGQYLATCLRVEWLFAGEAGKQAPSAVRRVHGGNCRGSQSGIYQASLKVQFWVSFMSCGRTARPARIWSSSNRFP